MQKDALIECDLFDKFACRRGQWRMIDMEEMALPQFVSKAAHPAPIFLIRSSPIPKLSTASCAHPTNRAKRHLDNESIGGAIYHGYHGDHLKRRLMASGTCEWLHVIPLPCDEHGSSSIRRMGGLRAAEQSFGGLTCTIMVGC
jgi:hypothetical protein